MRPAIVIDGGHLEFTLLFKEGSYFFIVHADLVPAVHLFFSPAMLRYCFRYHSVSPKACKLTIARTSSRDSQTVGNTLVHVAAQPQLVLLDMFVCFACASAHAKHTNMYYNLWSPQATHLYGTIARTI